MKSIVTALTGLIITGCSQFQHIESKTSFDPSRSTLQIQAIAANGKQNLGSGVVIAPNKIATNCHVIRHAKRAYLSHPERLYPIIAQAALPEFDACILETKQLNLPAAKLADLESVHNGDDIILTGYPLALGLSMKRGNVIALHPYGNNDRIIEINTGFQHGASGGGVFNNKGELIGLMTFMGPEGGRLRFYVIPASWLAVGLKQEFAPLKPFSARSFWEKGEFVKPLQK
jgi:serine protease Do